MDLNVREDPILGVYVENLSEYICHTPVDVFELLRVGRKRLVFAETRMNRQSSRSHSVCQITVERTRKKNKSSDSPKTESSSIESCRPPVQCSSPVPPLSPTMSVPTLNIQSTGDNIPIVQRTSPRNSTSKEKRLSLPPAHKPVRNWSGSSGNLTGFKRTKSTELTVASKRRSSTNTPGKNSRVPVKRVESERNLTRNGALSPEPGDFSGSQSILSLTSDGNPELESLTVEDMEWNAFNASTPDVFQYSESMLTQNEETERSHQDGTDDTVKLVSLDDDMVLRGKINICDLAGSERIKKTHAEGERLQEAQHINLSLLELGNVIAALAEGTRAHIPYRNSVLTRLLQDSLGGNCKTSFVLCVSPTMRNSSETKCTLEFGQRALRVSTTPRVNVEVNHKRLAKELQRKLDAKERENKALKEDYDRSMAEIKTELTALKESLCDDEVNSLRSEVERLHAELNVERQWNASTLDLERTRSILLAQLMSVQLVYSMEDISRISSTSPQNSIRNNNEPGFKQRNHLLVKEEIDETDNARNNHSPTSSLPSGYETGSCKSTNSYDGKADTPDLDTFTENHDTSPEEQRRESQKSLVKQDFGLFQIADSSQVCSPLLSKLRAPYSPKRNQLLENLLESQMHGIGIESIDLQDSSLSVKETAKELRKEIAHLKSSVDSEVGEFFIKTFGEDQGMKSEDGHLSKRKLYSHAAQQLVEPEKSSRFSVNDLDQALNLVILDHALIGCVLALSKHGKQHERDMNSDKRLSRISKKSSSMEHLDAIDLPCRPEQPDGASKLSIERDEEEEIQGPSKKKPGLFRRLMCAPGFSKKKSKKTKT